jgi:hypothetical protein
MMGMGCCFCDVTYRNILLPQTWGENGYWDVASAMVGSDSPICIDYSDTDTPLYREKINGSDTKIR